MIGFIPVALSFTAVLMLFLAAVLFIVVWKIAKKVVAKLAVLLFNSLAGLIVLLTLNLLFDASIPVNPFTVGVTGLFGLAGIGTLILLKVGGII